MKRAAPGFSLVDLNGRSFDLGQFKGKIVIVEFMATRYTTCIQQTPSLQEVWTKYRDRIILITIDVDDSESQNELGTF